MPTSPIPTVDLKSAQYIFEELTNSEQFQKLMINALTQDETSCKELGYSIYMLCEDIMEHVQSNDSLEEVEF